jgi:hypothetical protein
MIRTLIKVAIAVLVINAAGRLGYAYFNFYRFEDAVQQVAQFGDRRTDKQVCDEILDHAANYGVPIAAAAIMIQRGGMPSYNCGTGPGAAPSPSAVGLAPGQIAVDATYVDKVQVIPGYIYEWEFKPAVKVWARPY